MLKVNHKTITAEDVWSEFCDSCLHGCPPLQISEMRKAFYAGLVAAADIMSSIPDDFTEEQHSRIFSAIFKDAEEFLLISKTNIDKH